MSAEVRPQRADGLEVHEVEDGLVVYQSATDRVHYLNATAAVVFELCTGDNSERDIETLVADAWDLPAPPHDEVQECLEQLRAEGLVTGNA